MHKKAFKIWLVLVLMLLVGAVILNLLPEKKTKVEFPNLQPKVAPIKNYPKWDGKG